MIYSRLLLVVCLAGCTTNNVVVVAPALVANAAPSPCRLPPNSPAIKSPGLPLVHTTPIMPAMAIGQHMSGCAGVLFRITASGLPAEMKVLVEIPQGLGFGDAALASLSGDKFKPGQSTTDWRYETYTFRVAQQRT